MDANILSHVNLDRRFPIKVVEVYNKMKSNIRLQKFIKSHIFVLYYGYSIGLKICQKIFIRLSYT